MFYLDDFPFTRPLGSEVSMFIQWKGTEVCLDFTCLCGFKGHIDDCFVYYVECPQCESVYQMGTQVIAKKISKEEAAKVTTHILGADGC